MRPKIKREIHELKTLLRSLPPMLLLCFSLAVILMNLLANKNISIPLDWLALDCGILVSWVSFLSMDILTKHFGPKAATEVSLLALLVNLCACLIFFLISLIPGSWGESYVPGSEDIINLSLNRTFGGSWYVLLGSTLAFTVSAVVNNFLNFAIGRCFRHRPDAFSAYLCRSYISTAVGQFLDNLVFALIVSHSFFGWTLPQCLGCAATGMLVELLCEAIFSPIGYRICKRWQAEGRGRDYLELRKGGHSA